MPRIRYIKPGIMVNEELCELGEHAYILFTSLWMLADREGRLEDRPKRIKVEGMPFWNCDVEMLLGQLASAGFIERYAVNGERYIHITNWKKHQRPHARETGSRMPAPPQTSPRQCLSTTKAVPEHRQGSAKASPKSASRRKEPRIPQTTTGRRFTQPAREATESAELSRSAAISSTGTTKAVPEHCLGDVEASPRLLGNGEYTEYRSTGVTGYSVATEHPLISSSSPSACEIEINREAGAAAAAAAAQPTTVRVQGRRTPAESAVQDQGRGRSSSSSSFAAARRLAKELARTHPQRGNLAAAAQAIAAEHLSDEQCDEMVRSHERYVAYYARAQPEFVPNLERWVSDGDWQLPVPDEKPPKKPVSRTMRLAMEMEAEEAERAARKSTQAGANGRAAS